MVDVSVWWRYSLLLFIFGLPFRAYGEKKAADIFEQPTEEKVGAGSTFFITPRDVKQNYRKYHRIDRSITKMDRFTVAEQYNYNFQNLGNIWTAGQHIFYSLPQHIGASYGLTAYDFYFQHPQDIRYYCTSKAYAHFNTVRANLGTFLFDGCYSQRLLENWHIGINFYGAMTENEWPHGKDDKIVGAFPHFDVFTHIKTPDECYHLFTSWSNMKYRTRETGGVRYINHKYTFAFETKDPSERYRSSLPLLEEPYMENKISKENKVIHEDRRRHFYLYHHYELSEPLQLYHEFHYSLKKNLFTIKSLNKILNFISEYEHPLSNNDGYNERSSVAMQSLRNEIGVKGDIERCRLFYKLHYRLEAIHLNYDFSKPKEVLHTPIRKGEEKEKEHYLGGHTRFNCTKSGLHKLYIDGEYLFQKAGYHKLNVAYENSFSKLAYHTVQYKVPYIVQYGYSSYRPWDKDFVPPSAQQMDAEVWYAFPYVRIHPILSFKKIYNHIYYRKAIKSNGHDHCISEPIQATAPIDLLSWGGHLDFCFFAHFHFDHTFTFLQEISNGQKIFKGYMPPYMYTSRYYYAHQPFQKKMDIETGVNIHYKELYYADGYDVVAQQFYRQHQFAVQGKPIVDLFCNFRISNLKLSIKYSYINGYFGKLKTYFATPFYPAQKPTADLGIHWSFFD